MTLQTEIEKTKDDSQVEQLFRTMVICIDYIYDAEKMYSNKDHTEKELTDFLESLTDPQFQKISKFFETMPKLKHVVTVENPKTKVKSDILLQGLNDFFV